MSVLVLIMLAVCIGIPLAYAWRVFRLDEPSRTAWLLAVGNAAVIVSLVFLLGRWDMAGYYTRFLLVALFGAAVLRSLVRHAARPWRSAGPVPRSRWTALATLALLGAALGYVGSGLLRPEKPRDLAFPLEGGRFMVGQGGGIGLLNRHAGHPAQRHAADIVAIGAFGFRASGLLPEALDRYAIYGAAVVSPCDGAVVAARDGLPDLVPPEADSAHPRGNHAILDCGGFNVEIAHLQEGSLAIAPGDRIAAGDAIGRVGNSGNTTEPHLHIHAVDPDRGIGLPMAFDGRSPVRNRLFGS